MYSSDALWALYEDVFRRNAQIILFYLQALLANKSVGVGCISIPPLSCCHCEPTRRPKIKFACTLDLKAGRNRFRTSE